MNISRHYNKILCKVVLNLVLLIFILPNSGCDYFISQKETERAIYTVMRGFEASTKGIAPEVSNMDGNTVELKFISPDNKVETNISLYMTGDDAFNASGICSFSGYKDRFSGYNVNGQLEFEFLESKKGNINWKYVCNVKMTGSNIKTLKFDLEINEGGQISVSRILANNRAITLNGWDRFLSMFNGFSRNKFNLFPKGK